MTSLADVNRPLSLATPVLEQWIHEWSSHSVRDGGSALAQRHALPLTKAVLAAASADYLTCHQQSPQCRSIPQEDQAS